MDIQHNSIECHYAVCHYAESRDYLNVILSVIMLNFIVLSVVRLNVIMLSVVAPPKDTQNNSKSGLLCVKFQSHSDWRESAINRVLHGSTYPG
jgi:hypothetical protein